MTFGDEGSYTRVRCVAIYALPGGPLSTLGAPVLARYLHHHIEAYYAALKAAVEAHQVSTHRLSIRSRQQ